MGRSPPSDRRRPRTEYKDRRYNNDDDERRKSRRRSRSRSNERKGGRYRSEERDKYSRDVRSRDRERHRHKDRDNRRLRDTDDRKDYKDAKPNPVESIQIKEELIPWNEFPAPKPKESNSAKKPFGKLPEDTNMVNGVVVKYVKHPEAKAPKVLWQLHPFRNQEGKDPESLPVMHIHRRSCYLIGRDRKVVQFPMEELSKGGSEIDNAEIQVEEEEFGIVDPRLSMKGPGRGRRSTFKFVKEGEYQKQAHIQRNTARLHLLQSEIETVAKQTGISTAVKLALVTPDVDQGTSAYLPSIEWWDENVIQKKSYDAMPSLDLPPEQRYMSSITRLIEHPIQLKAPDEPVIPTMLKVYLTKKERKKLRRQNRREILKEEAEKVRLGLKPPPEPKVKIGNLMKVLGTDAIQDPTKMEAHVREQMAARMNKHLVSFFFYFNFI
uniref:Pre-mRNA-splicing factor 3 domain-containing protein n=1 Tax=Panagrolaimus superbus TaxID=310955 RepID=A0A914YV01_9BILA